MALKGTLKDFGIADILQLIGQQTKTGQLHLKAKDQEVHISFKDGNIVRAESSTRKKKDLIGSMLVRAELIKAVAAWEAAHPDHAGYRYYERWLEALQAVLASKGVVTAAEADTRARAFADRPADHDHRHDDHDHDHRHH